MRLDHITLKRSIWTCLRVFFNAYIRLTTDWEVHMLVKVSTVLPFSLPGDNSEWEPPEPIPNSEVKLLSANDSVGFHVKVGHCQALNMKTPGRKPGVFLLLSDPRYGCVRNSVCGPLLDRSRNISRTASSPTTELGKAIVKDVVSRKGLSRRVVDDRWAMCGGSTD